MRCLGHREREGRKEGVGRVESGGILRGKRIPVSLRPVYSVKYQGSDIGYKSGRTKYDRTVSFTFVGRSKNFFGMSKKVRVDFMVGKILWISERGRTF